MLFMAHRKPISHFLLPAIIFISLAVAGIPSVNAQSKKASGPAPYEVEMLGSTIMDTVVPFPVPIAFLRLGDTVNYRVSVRFPRLGILGLIEDTALAPTFSSGDTLFAFAPMHEILQVAYPKMMYGFYVDVYDRKNGKLVNSKLIPHEMVTAQYKEAKVEFVHEPTAALGDLQLRREFRPKLLPMTLETNPGWLGVEQLDSSGIYSLTFRDPAQPSLVYLSLTIRSTAPTKIDSTAWEEHKQSARLAFGAKGVGIKDLGDFELADLPTRHIMKEGYEFITKHDENMEYVATFLTPRAMFLLMAPILPDMDQESYKYYQAIARSFKIY